MRPFKVAVDAMLLLTGMEADDLKADLLRSRSDLDIAEFKQHKQSLKEEKAASKLQALIRGRRSRAKTDDAITKARDERLAKRHEVTQRQRLNIAVRRFYTAQDIALPSSVKAIVDHYWDSWELIDERLKLQYDHLPATFSLAHFIDEGFQESLGHQRAQAMLGTERAVRVTQARTARSKRRPRIGVDGGDGSARRAATSRSPKRATSRSPSRSPKAKSPLKAKAPSPSKAPAKASEVERGVPYRKHIQKRLNRDLPFSNSASTFVRKMTTKAAARRGAAEAATSAANSEAATASDGAEVTPAAVVDGDESSPHAQLRVKLLECAAAMPSGMRPNAVRAVRDLYLRSIDFNFKQYPPTAMSEVRAHTRLASAPAFNARTALHRRHPASPSI